MALAGEGQQTQRRAQDTDLVGRERLKKPAPGLIGGSRSLFCTLAAGPGGSYDLAPAAPRRELAARTTWPGRAVLAGRPLAVTTWRATGTVARSGEYATPEHLVVRPGARQVVDGLPLVLADSES